ncbi:MAG: exo-beta-N-acetylmuramidase NamZ family protein, partial [Verrucomicrobiales bacterium]
VKDGVDRKTGLPIRSLFAKGQRGPKPGHLEGLDALVFDIQDIGCRFYTYISTMGLCMEAAAAAGIKFFVLDRANPIGGLVVDGPVRAGEESFTAFHDIPVRHGMTVGELAQLFRAERCPDLQLEIVPLKGWKRGMLFGETGIGWVNPSPNIRNLNQALIYPGVGMLEFTNLSVGRGTVAPFELVGAPYIDPEALAGELRAARLAGFYFVPVSFEPESSVFKGDRCGGVKILVTDPDRCDSVALGIALGIALARVYPDDWETQNLDKLLAHPPSAAGIVGGKSMAEIRKGWEPELSRFLERREKALLYPN